MTKIYELPAGFDIYDQRDADGKVTGYLLLCTGKYVFERKTLTGIFLDLSAMMEVFTKDSLLDTLRRIKT